MPYTQDPSVLIQHGASAYIVCEKRIQAKLKPKSPAREKYQDRPLYYGAFLAKGLIQAKDKERQKGKTDSIVAYCFILGVFKQYMAEVNTRIKGFKSEHDDYQELSNEIDGISDWVADEEQDAEGWAEDFRADAAAAIDKTVDELYDERASRLTYTHKRQVEYKSGRGYKHKLVDYSIYGDFFGKCLDYLNELEKADSKLNRLRYVDGGGSIEDSVNVDGLKPSKGPFVFDDAQVRENVVLADTPEIRNEADISGSATISGRALVSGNAQVSGEALITDDSYVAGDAVVTDNACLYGNSEVGGEAEIYGEAMLYDQVYVGGNAKVGTCKLYNDTIVEGNAEIDGGAVIYGGTWDGSEGPVYGGVWRGPGEPL